MPSKKSTNGKVLAVKPNVQEKPAVNGSAEKNGKHTNGTEVKGVQREVKPKSKKAAIEPKPQKATKPAKKSSKKPATKAVSKEQPATVELRLRFHTKYGQSIYIMGNTPVLGDMNVNKALPLQYLDTHHWSVRLNAADVKGNVCYQYLLKHEDGTVEYDWGLKKLDAGSLNANIVVLDSWNHAGYFENAFYTEPFQDVLLPKRSFDGTKTPRKVTHRFMVKAPLLKPTEVVCLLGHGEGLTSWNMEAPILLNKKTDEDTWYADVNLDGVSYIEYKYGVYDIQRQSFVRYEDGRNRFAPASAAGVQVHVNDGFVVLPNHTWKGAGIAIPVFSLRTKRSFGVGEFTDLKLLIDWAKTVGMKMIQILPVNDTSATYSWTDSYPYAAISAFALHPMFLDLEKATDQKNRHLFDAIAAERESLNASTTVDYCAVIRTKLDYIRKVYPLQSDATFRKKEYKEFFAANEHWLVPYAVFCYLKDEFGTSDFNQWPEHQVYDAGLSASLMKPGSAALDKIRFHFFVQYHLHLQLKEATEYAHQHQVIVKGDIPIGVYRYGADAWQHPELFHMNVQAGAPPDDFAVKGQNWGFPTYNWDRMKQDGFEWWRLRFEQMSYYFDAFRIDHILGFFRIWSIPLHAVEGIMGHFVPAVPVHVNEFAERGIHFDYNRYCRPYITESVLQQVFGERAGEVKSTFLKENGYEAYVLRDEFRTQRQIEQYFSDKGDAQLRDGLYDLVSNIILFEEEGSQGTQFHFRFAMEDTLSFQGLDHHTREQLRMLYVNYFFERQDFHWKIEAMKKLPGLKRSTNMLICGEDLGLVPHSVPEVMKQLGILSLEIQRMPKAVNQQFFDPAKAPYMSVVTPSTHDMSTIRGWWEENRSNTQKFFNTELKQHGEAPYFCEPWINKAIVMQHLQSPAMWSIFQMQDLLGTDGSLRRSDPGEERINLPSNPKHYWNYRMHISLEDLLQADEFNQDLANNIASSGRN